jgi:hypothetical protein
MAVVVMMELLGVMTMLRRRSEAREKLMGRLYPKRGAKPKAE